MGSGAREGERGRKKGEGGRERRGETETHVQRNRGLEKVNRFV